MVALVGCASTPHTPDKPFVNTLGMKFVSVPGTEAVFCIWETRVKDYVAYAAANAGVDESWKKFPIKPEATHPVVKVSWNDARAFCVWLTKKELAEGKLKAGQRYRLPTDAEWSVAVGLSKETGNTPEEKSGKIGVYPWGKEYPPPKGAGNYDASLGVDSFSYTSPVGSFAANAHGLHDLGGNVWEWCEDTMNTTSPNHVTRGGSWHSTRLAWAQNSSFREDKAPTTRSSERGFRCVLSDGSNR